MIAVKPAEHLKREAHHLYDNPVKWGTPGIWEAPTFDLTAYQERIDAVAGKTPEGRSIVRCVWAWDSRTFHNVKWDQFGRALKGEWRQRYRFVTVSLGDGTDVDISVPRFILEELVPAPLLAASWEKARYYTERLEVDNPDDERTRRVDKLGELPTYGYYKYLRTICEHEEDESCCEKAWQESRRRCWGYYRLPQDKDINRLQRAVSLRDRDPLRRAPDEPLDVSEIEALDRLAYATQREEKQKNVVTLGEGLADWGQAHLWKVFTDSYKRQKWGRWQTAFPYKIDPRITGERA